MEKLGIALASILIASLIILLVCTLGTLTGACAGWIVGLFFAGDLLPIFARLGLGGFTMWQLGAFLGFVGAFFRASLQAKK